jgi:uncharacterized protein (TIGR03905 family)
MHYSYKTKGVCSSKIDIELESDIVQKVTFTGGCSGNASGISMLVRGMTVDEIQKKLKGVRCGHKSTSCPDQLAIAVEEAYRASAADKS